MSTSMSPENKTNENKPTETDSEKIVRRHLENKDDEITDEDLRSVRIIPTNDEPTIGASEAKARSKEDVYEETKSESGGKPADDDLNSRPATPWDVLGE